MVEKGLIRGTPLRRRLVVLLLLSFGRCRDQVDGFLFRRRVASAKPPRPVRFLFRSREAAHPLPQDVKPRRPSAANAAPALPLPAPSMDRAPLVRDLVDVLDAVWRGVLNITDWIFVHVLLVPAQQPSARHAAPGGEAETKAPRRSRWRRILFWRRRANKQEMELEAAGGANGKMAFTTTSGGRPPFETPTDSFQDQLQMAVSQAALALRDIQKGVEAFGEQLFRVAGLIELEGKRQLEQAAVQNLEDFQVISASAMRLVQCPLVYSREFLDSMNVRTLLPPITPLPLSPLSPLSRVAPSLTPTPKLRGGLVPGVASPLADVVAQSAHLEVEAMAQGVLHRTRARTETLVRPCGGPLSRAYVPGCWTREDHTRIQEVRTAVEKQGAAASAPGQGGFCAPGSLEDAEIMRFLDTGASPETAVSALKYAIAHKDTVLPDAAALHPGHEGCSQLFWLGGGAARSEKGCPILVLRTHGDLDCELPDALSGDFDASLQACVFQRIEWGRQHLDVGIDTPVVLLIDTSPPTDSACSPGADASNGGTTALLKLLPLLPVHLPGVVDTALVGPVGRWTVLAWSGMRKTMDRDLQDRVELVSQDGLEQKMADALGPARPFIPKRLGGALPSPEFGAWREAALV